MIRSHERAHDRPGALLREPVHTEPESVAPLCLTACPSAAPVPKAGGGEMGGVREDKEGGGGVNLSTSKGSWGYSGAHHSASSFLPVLLSLPEPFPAYLHVSSLIRERVRDREKERERARLSLQESFGWLKAHSTQTSMGCTTNPLHLRTSGHS